MQTLGGGEGAAYAVLLCKECQEMRTLDLLKHKHTKSQLDLSQGICISDDVDKQTERTEREGEVAVKCCCMVAPTHDFTGQVHHWGRQRGEVWDFR